MKEEIGGFPDDQLIDSLDGIIANLQTGDGEFNLHRNGNKKYQEQLAKLEEIWEQMNRVRNKNC